MRLRKRAEEIISMVDKTEAEFTSAENPVSGDIYIGGGETRAMHEIAEIIKELRESYPDIHFHLYSGNAADVTERLDKGLLDFGVLIQPADISKYNYFNLYEKDIWGVIMRKDSPLAEKEHIKKEDLLDLPLICSRQAISPHQTGNAFSDWFGEDFEKLDIVITFNLVYNAAILVDAGIGYAITLDNLADTSGDSNLCFRPLEPYQLFLELCLKVRIRLYIKLIRQIETVPRISGQRPPQDHFGPAAMIDISRVIIIHSMGHTIVDQLLCLRLVNRTCKSRLCLRQPHSAQSQFRKFHFIVKSLISHNLTLLLFILIEYSFNIIFKKKAPLWCLSLTPDRVPAHLKDQFKIHIREHGFLLPPFLKDLLDRIIAKADQKRRRRLL